MLSMLLSAFLLASQTAVPAQPTPLGASIVQPAPITRWPVQEAEYHVANFRFRDGSTLPDLRIHYSTLGAPHRNAAGEIDNAIMVLHGTGGTGHQFLVPQFADELYGSGQPLDIRRYWIILPDGIGHGASSKPSDGQHMRFPRYTYDDMWKRSIACSTTISA
jgi:homoserine O-acetyltransferase